MIEITCHFPLHQLLLLRGEGKGALAGHGLRCVDPPLPWSQKVATFHNEAKRVAERCSRETQQAVHESALESRMRRNGYSAGDLYGE